MRSTPSNPSNRQLRRVVFVAFIGERNANGGVNSLFELVSRLQRNVQCTIVTQKEHPLLERWKSSGLNMTVVSMPSGSGRLYQVKSLFLMYRKLSRLLKKTNPDVVVCNDIRSVLYASLASRRLKIPLAFFIRDIFPPGKKYGFKWRAAGRTTHLILCLSREMAGELGRRLRPLPGHRLNIQHVYSVVDFEKMHPVDADSRKRLRIEAKIPPEEFCVVYAAGFCNKKNQLELLKHLPQLVRAIPHAHVHFLGDFSPQTDDYSRRCQALATESGLQKHVTFHGYADNMADWYRMADCTLLASRREGLARCMIESISCGTAVVSFDVTSAKEVLEGYDCGLVARQGNYDQLIDHVTTLAGDSDLRQKFGGAGAEAARTLFQGHANAAQFEVILRNLIRA